jgi:uncharacterized protein YndB with AHSA1/START domain
MAETKVVVDPNTQSITLTRDFDAPRELVFKVITDPELIPQWWGPRSLTTRVDRMEVRPGGVWRFLHRDRETGAEYGFHGVYHAVAPECIVQTFEFEGAPGHVAMETMTFDDLGGTTRMTTASVYQTVTDRDMVVQSGMESGARETHDRLQEVLDRMKSGPGTTR